jgi:hypothetical protein
LANRQGQESPPQAGREPWIWSFGKKAEKLLDGGLVLTMRLQRMSVP